MRLRMLAVLCFLFLVGCSSTAHRREMFPAYYRGWEPTPETLSQTLEETRNLVIEQPDEMDALLDYSRATSQLARIQSRIWLELRAMGDRGGAAQEEQIAASRSRVVKASSSSLSLFRQYELTGGTLDWRGHVEMVWLLLLVGSDHEAEQRIAFVLTNPEVPVDVRTKLELALSRFESLPEKATP